MKNRQVELEEAIKQSFDRMDEVKVKTPDLNYFTKLIQQQEAIQLKKQNLQFAAFIGCAIVLVSLLFFSLFAYTVIFLIIQVLAAMVPVLLLAFSLFNRKERV